MSSCLLGQAVRWDGDHKRNRFLTDVLSQYVEYVPVCPEVAIGLGVPRSPIRLIAGKSGVRAVGVDDGTLDVTEQLAKYGRSMASELDDVCGYIFKSGSPSCGMERVKMYRSSGGVSRRNGAGVYARAFLGARADLPVEEEGRLSDPTLRENFLERIFAYRRWQSLSGNHLTPAGLVAFHTAHKLSLMAHGIEPYRALSRLVAKAGRGPVGSLAEAYVHGFMAALKRPATRNLHVNVLEHLTEYVKSDLNSADRADLAKAITQYRRGRVPRAVPMNLLRHHFRSHPHCDVVEQVYLNPEPAEAMLTLHNQT